MNTERRIQNIMDNYNFDKVLIYMTFTKWKWRGQVVGLEDLKRCAEDLLNTVANSPNSTSSASTGGFHAYKLTYGSDSELKLAFSIETKRS